MYHLGVHIDYRYVSLLFIRVHIVFMHCSSPTVLSHVPFVAFLLELCAVQCLLSVKVLHTTMYYMCTNKCTKCCVLTVFSIHFVFNIVYSVAIAK